MNCVFTCLTVHHALIAENGMLNFFLIYCLLLFKDISLDFLAHLSQRLIGELIGYSWSGVRPSVRRRTSSPTISNIFFSETTGPIKAQFYVEPPWVGGTIFCLRHLGHMTKMAATPIYGKNPSKYSSPEPAGRFPRNLVCSIGDSCPS